MNDLTLAIKETTKSYGLSQDKNLISQCHQIVDLLNIRHGIIIVGPKFTGKSTILKILENSFNLIRNDEIKDRILE